MFNLYTSYFITDKKRQDELLYCLKMNCELYLIKKVYLLIEEPIDFEHEKVEKIMIKSRPTYSTIFDLVNLTTNEGDWNIISNSDIYFDQTLERCSHYTSRRPICIALTRWEINPSLFFLNRRDSQDCWMFKGKIYHIDSDFKMGVPGCDNTIADRISRAGYDVINPSRTIKSYHVHKSSERNYGGEKTPMPYKFLVPSL